MKANSADIADFYRQMSLLLKSNLPLPESMRQLGLNLDKADLRSVLLEMSKMVSKGEGVADAMSRYPKYFPKFHIRMVDAAEMSDMLPEVLQEIADIAYLDSRLARMVREISVYPLFGINLAFLIWFGLFVWVIPEFKPVFKNLLWGEPLPRLTDWTMMLSDFLVAHRTGVFACWVLLVVFLLWLFSGGVLARRMFIRVISTFPGAGLIYSNLNMARFCGIWSLLARRKVDVVESMETIAPLMDDWRVAAALSRVGDAVRRGEPLVAALREEKRISGMLPLTVRHVPEKDLPDELANLSLLFRERAASATRKAGVIWAVVFFVFLVLSVGITILSLFMPFISFFKMLGGW